MKTVFITRDLSEDSIFRKRLEGADLKVFGESLIQFSAIPFEEIPATDWIFFYSKNGIKYFFQGLEQTGLAIPEDVKLAVIGSETAKALTAKFKAPDFVGNGHGSNSATPFLKIAKGQKVLFPQAESSLRALQQILENEIVALDFIVYKNTPKQQVNIPKCDSVVFTSPLNVKVYINKMQTLARQKLFAIGQTTANALIDLGIADFEIADYPSEESLADAIVKTLKSGA